MTSLQKILAENMLRFGTKNLKNSKFRKYLYEALVPYGVVKTYQDLKKEVGSYPILILRNHEDKVVNIPIPNISAQFYNNMVTLENGLMSPATKESIAAEIDKNLIEELQKNPDIDLTKLKLNVTGTASSAKPSMNADTRMPAGTKLDHPDTAAYGGIDVTKPENYLAGNQYLAKKRAEAISALIKERFIAASLTTPTLTTTAKVLEGNADALRYLEVTATANSKTDNITEKWNTFLTFNANVQYKDAKTPAQAVSDIEDTLTGGSEQYANIKSYRASISIHYGAPKGESISWTGTYNAVDDAKAEGHPESYAGFSTASTRTSGDGWVQGSPELAINKMNSGKGSNALTGAIPSIGDFLSSCGHFTSERAKEIEDNLNNVESADFKALSDKGTGNLNDFVTALGGSTTPSLDNSPYAYVYDTKTGELFKNEI